MRQRDWERETWRDSPEVLSALTATGGGHLSSGFLPPASALPRQLIQYVAKRDGALFLCQQISLSNISSAIKEVTGRKWWIQIRISKMKAGGAENGRYVYVRALVHVHHRMHATLVPSHLTRWIYITYLNFHYFSWKDFVIGFFQFFSSVYPRGAEHC